MGKITITSSDRRIVRSTVLLSVLTAVAGLLTGLFMGFNIGRWPQAPKWPVVDLPEEFMCVASESESKPDTVLAFQSARNDTLFIRFKH